MYPGERAHAETPDALLSVEASTQAVRALRWWSEPQRAHLSQAVEAALRRWQQAWDPAPAEPAGEDIVRCEPAAGPVATMTWRALPVDARIGRAWYALTLTAAPDDAAPSPLWAALLPSLVEQLASHTHGLARDRTGHSANLAQETAHAAWTDCGRHLADLFNQAGDAAHLTAPRTGSADEAPALDIWVPWSGALRLTVRWWSTEIHVLVGDGCVRTLLGSGSSSAPAVHDRDARGDTVRRPELVPVIHALAGYPITMNVELTPVELDLGALTTMSVGDVLRTSHELSTPLLVTDERGKFFCGGFLGRSDDRRAIELLSDMPSVTPVTARTGPDIPH
ncbi:hypothetical protein BWP39_29095 [Paraburkholderia acidicola]|uniref:Flagellar motor switch protein FliN-like C-terminal domain-containing protein n=2 Tax=Paraburkholderia acidicola TaxID=1912599 RepID=A0A2A4ETL3_9BURK|nr:hypothetical protein BWP39_29095 [Paraburkholderia acidicola]